VRQVLLAGTVIVALVVRLAGIGDTLSADEGYSWLVADGPFLDNLEAYENTPPLFYLLLEPLPLDDEVWLRLPSLVAGAASVPVLYAAVRPLLGTPAALLSALGLAVAPYFVSFSNYSRGFVLATFGLLLCLWAAARLAQGGRNRWWWLYAAGAVTALYSEYYTALFLAALVIALVALGRREALVYGIAPALALVPWIPELIDQIDALDETKVEPTYPSPAPASLRDVATALALGEHGAADSAGARWLQLAAIAGAVGAAAVSLRRYAPATNARVALWLFGGVPLIALAGHAIVAVIGPDIFQQRYLTALIPPVIALLAGGIAVAPQREAVPIAAAALLALGAAVVIERHDRELEPDPSEIRNVAKSPVLTNSAVAAFYLRDFDPVVDRPFGLTKGREAELCKQGCLIVEDNRVAGGVRGGQGIRLRSGPYSIRRR
jgi:Dolichyl-phosphate-mannose-protein mannosyltransferase